MEREREKSKVSYHRESDKFRKIEKQDKLDKLEKLEMMAGSDRVKHLEAQMLSKIQAMDLEPKMIMDDQVCCRLLERLLKITSRLLEYAFYWEIARDLLPPQDY